MSFYISTLTLAFAFSSVASWTIDLPEVRQYYFTKYGDGDQLKKDENKKLQDGEFYYNNYYSNSEYDTENRDIVRPLAGGFGSGKVYENIKVEQGDKYADEYAYHDSYMEKKMPELGDGGRYLEGLRDSITRFGERLQNCTQMTKEQLKSSGLTAECAELMRRGGYVSRVTDLALHTTRLMQDRASKKDYKHELEDTSVDRALVLRLAFFLEKLHELTGFEPHVNQDDLNTSTPSPTSTASSLPPPLPVNPFNFSLPVNATQSLVKCLEGGNSSVPAYQRCKYTHQFPPGFLKFINFTDPEQNSKEDSSRTPEESLEAVQTQQLMSNFPLTLPVMAISHVSKRSLPDDKKPLEKLLNYYSKYKTWTYLNPIGGNNPEPRLKEGNRIKRSLPEDPMAVRLFKKQTLNYNYNKKQAEKVREFLKNLTKKSSRTISVVKARFKRGSDKTKQIDYRDRKPARIPEDPMQDISQYVKRQPDVEYNPNAVQTAQVRAALEKIYEMGNILVVRQYGSNYNPAVTNHVLAGAFRSAADVYSP